MKVSVPKFNTLQQMKTSRMRSPLQQRAANCNRYYTSQEFLSKPITVRKFSWEQDNV